NPHSQRAAAMVPAASVAGGPSAETPGTPHPYQAPQDPGHGLQRQRAAFKDKTPYPFIWFFGLSMRTCCRWPKCWNSSWGGMWMPLSASCFMTVLSTFWASAWAARFHTAMLPSSPPLASTPAHACSLHVLGVHHHAQLGDEAPRPCTAWHTTGGAPCDSCTGWRQARLRSQVMPPRGHRACS
ncbi:Hypothetical predicted protein, partial [Olea europaea subsp. europaea]